MTISIAPTTLLVETSLSPVQPSIKGRTPVVRIDRILDPVRAKKLIKLLLPSPDMETAAMALVAKLGL